MKSYEIHITISPVFGDRRKRAEEIAQHSGFKLAKLVMIKENLVEEESKRDTFMTGYRNTEREASSAVSEICRELMSNGFIVERYKVEHILIDSKYKGDELSLLSVPNYDR